MAVQVKKIVRHNGKFFMPGDIIYAENEALKDEKDYVISDSESKRLVKKGLAEKIEVEEVKETDDISSELNREETIEETLELNFDTKELKQGADEQGLKYRANISKKDLINLIVESDKSDYFIEQLED